MANDYYDFNPSATTWVLMLTGVVVFVLALALLLIYMIARSEAVSTTPRAGAGDLSTSDTTDSSALAAAANPVTTDMPETRAS